MVNDEEKIRKSLSGLLQDNGYEVVTAKNGPECLQTMSSQDFDLVILDIVMPGISGIEVLQGIKERYKDTEVIMITGYADKEKAIAASRLNAYDFIEKPFESSEILNTIAHCLTQLSLRKDIEKKSQELRESEKKYRQLFETLQEGIWVIDKDAYTILINHSMAEMLGYTKSEMLGKHLFSFMDEHGVELAKRYLERRQQGIKERHDFEFIKKDGNRIYTSLDTAPITDEKGNYSGAIAAMHNITERKQVEALLTKTLNEYENIMNTVPDIIYLLDLHQNLIKWNRKGEIVTGFSAEEVMGKNVLDFFPEEDKAIISKAIREVFGKGFGEAEGHLLCKDGTLIPYRWTGVPLKDEQGKVIGLVGIGRDITRRKQAEKALKDSEERYRTLVETALVGVYRTNLKGEFLYANQALSTLFEFDSPEEMMSSGVLPRYKNPKDREVLIENLKKKEKVDNLELEVFTKTGKIKNILMNATLDGDVISGMALDITERKKAEESLRETRDYLEKLLNYANAPIIVWDPKSIITGFNHAFERLTGYTDKEVIGRELHVLFPETSQEESLKKIARTLSGEHWESVEIPILCKGGGIRIALWNSANIYAEDGRTLLATIAQGQDITERKKTEEFIKDIFESISDGLAVIDLDYRIVTANRAYYEHDGMTLEDIIGKHCYEVTHHRDKPCYEADEDCAVKHTFETGEFHTEIHKHYDREGGLLYVEIRSYPMKDSSGKVISAIEIVSDITEKKKLEGRLRHAQKMETVGTLAGGIAHDFNNILTAIIGYEHILQMEMRKDDPSKVYADRILALAERAANLTRGLLAFSRKQVINLLPVNLNEIVKRLEGILSRVIGEDVELETTLTDEELIVMADSSQMEQVLMNLCTNARDAMPDGGLLIIKTELVELDNEFIKEHGYGKLGMFARIVVADTGAGMDEETRRKIFEPFFTTKEVGKGTGLGLAIVYGTIKQHNGYINVYSTPGEGTTFTIYLPVIKVEIEETRLIEHAIPTGGTETVLVAEDDAEVRKLIKSILDGFGYAVIEAVDGEDAINKFMENKDRIQLLLLDVIMPKKSGKVVYEEIRQIRPDIKTLFASGYAMDIIQKIGILEEGLNFVLKPLSPKELLRKVREVLDK